MKKVIVTGGASFIGSHLVDRLVRLGYKVTVLDNLSSGKIENLNKSRKNINFVKVDLGHVRSHELIKIFRGNALVFHLASNHGGRGYISTHPADVCSNFAIDHQVFETSVHSNVEKVIFASSACVYPEILQNKYNSSYRLKEDDCNAFNLKEPLSADQEYGWTKLMGEIQLNAHIKQYGLKGCSLRFVTAYGPRQNETHSIIALIYKAFEQMDPFIIWGNGNQERDFTYVSDIVNGTILAAEKIDDGSAVNLGTGIRFKINEVANKILKLMKFQPDKITHDLSKQIGVISRALDISKAKKLLGWQPKISLDEGLKKTVEWYINIKRKKGRVNERKLLERCEE